MERNLACLEFKRNGRIAILLWVADSLVQDIILSGTAFFKVDLGLLGVSGQ